MENAEKKLYGMQFHPEVLHTENGEGMLRNFLYRVCGAKGDWMMGDYARNSIIGLKEKIGAQGRTLPLREGYGPSAGSRS